jgi:hypothetical protein
VYLEQMVLSFPKRPHLTEAGNNLPQNAASDAIVMTGRCRKVPRSSTNNKVKRPHSRVLGNKGLGLLVHQIEAEIISFRTRANYNKSLQWLWGIEPRCGASDSKVLFYVLLYYILMWSNMSNHSLISSNRIIESTPLLTDTTHVTYLQEVSKITIP